GFVQFCMVRCGPAWDCESGRSRNPVSPFTDKRRAPALRPDGGHSTHSLLPCVPRAVCRGRRLGAGSRNVRLRPLRVRSGAGGRVVLRDRPEPDEIPQLAARERVTILYAVPVTYRTMVSRALGAQPDLSSLRLCFSAGAALPRGTEEGFAERFGRRISQNYGT